MESMGDPGRAWLSGLPGELAGIQASWGLTLGRSLPGGMSSFVCSVRTRSGGPAVLKVALAGPGLDSETAVLRAADGHGYVHLLDADPRRGALLLEAAGEPLSPRLPDVGAALDVLARTLLHAWRVPLSAVPPVDDRTHKAATLARLITELAASERVREGLRPRAGVIEQALEYAGALVADRDETRQVVVHGDPHPENLLQSEDSRPGAGTGWLLVDPDGFRCEPEYDLGTAVREWNLHLLELPDPAATVRSWCARLADTTGCDAELIWMWGFTERVFTGLYIARHGVPERGAPFLEVAARLLPPSRW